MQHFIIEGGPKRLRENRLAAAIIFFGFTPFFSFFPIHTDVQPLTVILIFVFFVLYVRSISLSRLELTFLAVAVLSCVYVNPANPYFTFRESFGLLIAFATYWFFCRFQQCINQKIVAVAVFANFFAVLFHFLSPVLFSETLGIFVRDIKILNVSGFRGASGFASEPGFMGGLAVFYIAIAFYNRDYIQDCKYFYFSVCGSLLILILSKSGTGALLLIIFIIARSIRLSFVSILGGLAFVSVSFWLTVNHPEIFGRAGYTFRNLILDPRTLFFIDSSVGARVLNICIGLLSVLENPLGAGAGSYPRIASQVVSDYELYKLVAGTYGNISAFAKYSVELGLIFWFFLSAMAFHCMVRSGVRAIPYLLVALFFISASFSIVFPPTWILFALLHQRRRRKLPLITDKS